MGVKSDDPVTNGTVHLYTLYSGLLENPYKGYSYITYDLIGYVEL